MSSSNTSTMTLSIAETSTISVGGTVAAKIAARYSQRSENDNKLQDYRDLCEIRLQRLEKYKKTKSFCSLESDEVFHEASSSQEVSSNASICSTSSEDSTGINGQPIQSLFESQVEMLKQKMISMMETDVELLQKLVALGETIEEMKIPQSAPPKYRPRGLPRMNSETSLSSSYGEDDDDWRPLECGDPFSQSMTAITRLYVDNSQDDNDDEPRPNVQYFSRKNSVLRIPIPPRSSNRMGGNRKIFNRPSQLLRQNPPRLLPSEEDSGHSSSSDTTPPQQHSPVSSDAVSTVSSVGSSASRQPSYAFDIQERVVAKSSRRSNASVDSGIIGSDTSACSTTFVTTIKTEG